MQKFVRRKFVDSKCYTKRKMLVVRVGIEPRSADGCEHKSIALTATPPSPSASQGMQRLPSFLRSIPRPGEVLRGSSTKEGDVYDHGGVFFWRKMLCTSVKYDAEEARMRGFDSHGTQRRPFL